MPLSSQVMIIGSGPATDAAKKAAKQVGYVTQARGVTPAPAPQAPTMELLQQGALVQHNGIQRNDGAEWKWDWEAAAPLSMYNRDCLPLLPLKCHGELL